MAVVPAETPVTEPVPEPTNATADVPAVQIPPPGMPVKVAVSPAHRIDTPPT